MSNGPTEEQRRTRLDDDTRAFNDPELARPYDEGDYWRMKARIETLLSAEQRADELAAENARLRRTLRDIASGHLPSCGVTHRDDLLCDCGAEKARAALSAAPPAPTVSGEP